LAGTRPPILSLRVAPTIRHSDELRRGASLLRHRVDRVAYRPAGLESPAGTVGAPGHSETCFTRTCFGSPQTAVRREQPQGTWQLTPHGPAVVHRPSIRRERTRRSARRLSVHSFFYSLQVVFAVVGRSFRLAQQLSPSRAGRGSLVGKSRTMSDFRLLRIVLTSNSPKPFQARMHSRLLHSLSIVPDASRWRVPAVNAVSLATAIRATSDLDSSGIAARDAHTRRITSPSTKQ